MVPTPTVAPTSTALLTATPTPAPPEATGTTIPAPTPSPTLPPPPSDQTVDLPDVDAHYTLEINSLNLQAGLVDISETVDIISRQGAIPELYFSVATAKWGYFRFGSATIDGGPVTPESLNDGFTLRLTPPDGDRWTVGITYQLQLAQVPRDWYGSGMDGDIMRLGYWFPLFSTNFPYPSTADPAYSRVASFDVSLPLPNNLPFVSSGVEVRSEKIDSEQTRHFLHADKIRDFALVIAPGGQIDEVQTNNGVTIRLMSDAARSASDRNIELEAAKRAIERLSELIGPYPYHVFSIAEAGSSLPGGIEFPMLIQINPQIDPIDRLIYHETAHQWLYGIIGTRPQEDVWIDEGGAQFLEGFLDSGSSVPTPPADGYSYPLDSTDSELPQGAGIPGYASIYFQGQRFYQSVLDTMGPEAFWSAMRELYQQFAFGIVTPWDVLSTWQAHSKADLRPLFHSTFRYDWIDQLRPPEG